MFRRAFTLVELVIVSVIVGLLAAISIVGYSAVVDSSEQAAAEASADSVNRELRALAAFQDGSSLDDLIAEASASGDFDSIAVSIRDTSGNELASFAPGAVIRVCTLSGWYADISPEFVDGSSRPSAARAWDRSDAVQSAADDPACVGAAGFSDGGSGIGDPGDSGSGGSGGSGSAFSVSYSQQSFDVSSSSQALSPTITGATTGPVTYSITSGTLPTGVSFDTATGTFIGATAWNDIPTAITSDGMHTCMVLTDGTVECWGYNRYGQATVPSSVVNATAVTAGGSHSCALLSGGTIECWGAYSKGQSTVPSSVVNATAVDAGTFHTCALHSGGTVECWGDNDIANQTTVPSSVVNATAVSAGQYHTCALLSDGTVECWGDNANGESTVPSSVVNATAVDAGKSHTCAVHSGGTVECWGYNPWDWMAVPNTVVNPIAVATGDTHACAVLSGGTVECWGNNTAAGNTDSPAVGNDGFPATIEIEATDGVDTATFTVELTVS